jgi:hypothetical protein
MAGFVLEQSPPPEVDGDFTALEADPKAGTAPEWWRETPVER